MLTRIVVLASFVCLSLAGQQVDISQVSGKPFVDSREFAWFRTNGVGATGDLSASGAGKVISLSTCPLGLNSRSPNAHYLYISQGTGTAEAVLVTATTCNGASTGTVTVTTANTHAGSWRVGSATAGIQEAIYSSTSVMVADTGSAIAMYGMLFTRSNLTLEGVGYPHLLATFAVPKLTIVGSDVTIRGLWIEDNCPTVVNTVVFAGNQSHIQIDRNKLTTTTGSSTNNFGIRATEANITNVKITQNYVTGYTYAMETDSQAALSATGLKDWEFAGNTLTDVWIGILFNHPLEPACTGVRDVRVTGNHIQASLGTGTGGSGWGVALAGAGVCNVVIAGNTIQSNKTAGVYGEDNFLGLTVTGNTFQLNGKSDGFSADVYTIGGDDIVITGNTMREALGSCVVIAYDASRHSKRVNISNNLCHSPTAYGINAGADSTTAKSSWIISGNTIMAAGLSGILINEWPQDVKITGNIIRDSTQYGMRFAQNPRMAIFYGNSLYGNTLGDSHIDVAVLTPRIVRDAMTPTVNAVVSGGVTPWTNLFQIGQNAKGTVIFSGRNSNNAEYVFETFDISWNGTTLTQTAVGQGGAGPFTSITIRVSGGYLQGQIGYTNGETVVMQAQFVGAIAKID